MPYVQLAYRHRRESLQEMRFSKEILTDIKAKNDEVPENDVMQTGNSTLQVDL